MARFYDAFTENSSNKKGPEGPFFGLPENRELRGFCYRRNRCTHALDGANEVALHAGR